MDNNVYIYFVDHMPSWQVSHTTFTPKLVQLCNNTNNRASYEHCQTWTSYGEGEMALGLLQHLGENSNGGMRNKRLSLL